MVCVFLGRYMRTSQLPTSTPNFSPRNLKPFSVMNATSAGLAPPPATCPQTLSITASSARGSTDTSFALSSG
ncbi:hypothetical protein C8Q73DRAFT_693507 [Cubamyces lactineus]|nr:hypothetical protein C8Q73DRAFT_693507 [Cubamyces lactineus]